MTTPTPRVTVSRRPWNDYLKSNRERWMREAGKPTFKAHGVSVAYFVSLSAEEERRRKELKVIAEEP